MTREEMQKALRTGFNPQGRAVSFSMAVKYHNALAKPQMAKFSRKDYRGFEVSGGKGHWYVNGWQTIYTSEKKAMSAIDTCLALRELLAT